MKAKWVWLVLGLALAGGVFSYVGHRVAQATKVMKWRRPGRIVPAAVVWHKSGDLRQVELSRGDRELAGALRMLLRRVDSLRNDSSGRRVYDSLVESRPGLLDSSRVAERFYSLQELLNK
jgi:hypothetical protein